MLVSEKLMMIQQELKAPKGQYNNFGKYKYRSCEDILEAVKPLLGKNKAALTITDDLIFVGDRYYIKAVAILTDAETGEQIANTAFARESLEKKGMDDSQITGTASSYARKYALNGLFCIDDTKDADTDEYENSRQEKAAKSQATQKTQSAPRGRNERSRSAAQPAPQTTPTQAEMNPNAVKVNQNHIAVIRKEMDRTGITEHTLLTMFRVNAMEDMTMAMFETIMQKFKKTPAKVPEDLGADGYSGLTPEEEMELPFA